MKKALLVLCTLLLITSCQTNNSSSLSSSEPTIVDTSSSEESSTTTSEESSASSSSEKSEISSQKPTSSSPSSISSSEANSSSTSEKEEIEPLVTRYSSHPMSEPDINKQLVTFNPMGDLKNVWNHYRGDKVLVAVIDSGFDYDHPEFVDENGNSRVSDKSCYIYTNSSKQTKVEVGRTKVDITDGDSHGTMCAGLLGASVNNVGITGIAPNVELMLIKIDKHAYSMAEAFKYAADNGAKVISTSLGQYPNSNGESYGDIHFEKGVNLATVFNEKIKYAYDKGVTIVAATGNSRTTTLSYPAGCSYVIGAGGLDVGSKTAIWDDGGEGSNYNGSTVYVDAFAPSEGIYAPGYDTSTNKPTYWGDAKGTSFAAPLIAGAAALYLQKYPNATNKDVEKAIQNACVNISSYNGNKNMGWGRLDVGKLLKIDEDIKSNEVSSSTTISQKATKLTIVDEEGWDFRTLHLYNLEFEKGYGYKEFEDYLDYVYGQRVSTSSYQVEGTTRCYAYTDEDYVGDYYLCTGNTVHAQPTNYEYVFPWWVKGASYQIVNNSNWLPEDGGNKFTYSDGYGKDIKAYFWYDSPTSNDVTQVSGGSFTANMPAVQLSINQKSISTSSISSIFDYYEAPTGKELFDDASYNIKYIRKVFTSDSVIYSK